MAISKKINEENLDTSKKKRGRPKKTEAPIKNEESEIITMTKNNPAALQRDINNTVGHVKDSQYHDLITFGDIQNRWKEIFSKYSSMGMETLVSTWETQGMSALNNPFIQNKRIKQTNTNPLKMTKDELNKAISNPENSEYSLRAMSTWLGYTNYIYQALMQLNRDTAKYCYYANPLYVEDNDKTKIKEDGKRVDQILKKFNPQGTLKDVAAQVFLEGKCSYLIRTSYDKKDVNYLLLQKLNSENIKITGFGSKQKFIVSFNMIVFLQPGYSTSQYPKFIQDTWEEMITNGIIIEDKKGNKKLNPKSNLPNGHMVEMLANGSYMYWVQLPQDLSVTFYSNGAHPNAFPDTIGLLSDLNDLDSWRWLQSQIANQSVNAVMTAEVPMAYQPKAGADQTSVSPDVIMGYSDLWASTIGDSISFFAAPFTDFKLHAIETSPESLNVVYDRTRDLLASSGVSALISTSDKPSISATNSARMIQEAKCDYLTRQFEQFLNNVINDNFDLNYDWKITVHGSLFNWREDAKMTKELVLQGSRSLLPRLLSYYDMTLEDCKGAENYIDALGIKLISEEQAEMQQKISTIEEKSSVGRPKANINTIESDSTGASIDGGQNVSEIKGYSLEELEEYQYSQEQFEELE